MDPLMLGKFNFNNHAVNKSVMTNPFSASKAAQGTQNTEKGAQQAPQFGLIKQASPMSSPMAAEMGQVNLQHNLEGPKTDSVQFAGVQKNMSAEQLQMVQEMMNPHKLNLLA